MAVYACTIASRAYLPFARVLAQSFRRHHPDGRLWALLVDDERHEVDDAAEAFSAIRLADLDLPMDEMHRMAMLFSGDFRAAIKPWLFERLFAEGIPSLFYIDGDIEVFDSLEPLAAAAEAHGVVVTPNATRPMPRDGLLHEENEWLQVGMYNGGLFGCGRQSVEFLDFLKVRLRRECKRDLVNLRCNEQRWLDFVPALFPHQVVRDPGYNVSEWNLHERPLTRRDGRWFAGGSPLRCYHYSGYDPRVPGVLSVNAGNRARITMESDPLLPVLFDTYRRQLFQQGFERWQGTPFRYDFLADGTPVSSTLRRLYRDELDRAEAAGTELPPDPFDPDDLDRFRAWAERVYRRHGVPAPRWLRQPEATVDLRVPRAVGPAEPAPGRCADTADWLGRLHAGAASLREGERIRSRLVEDYTFMGPFARLDTRLAAGEFRVRLEFAEVQRAPGVDGATRAFFFDVVSGGYPLALRPISVAEVEAGTVDVAFAVPEALTVETMLSTIETRLWSDATVEAVVEEMLVSRLFGDTSSLELDPTATDWLAAMRLGAMGTRDSGPVALRRRAGVVLGDGQRVEEVPGRAAIVADGPYWRMAPGTYEATLALDGTVPRRPPPGPVATWEVVSASVVHASDGRRRLGQGRIGWDDVAAGAARLRFTVPPLIADDRGERVLAVIRAPGEAPVTLGSLRVARLEGGAAPAQPFDWLDDLGVGEAAERTAEGVRTRPGATGFIVYGPHWRFLPGAYRAELDLSARVPRRADPDEPVMVVDALTSRHHVLGARVLTWVDLDGGRCTLDFALPSELAADPDIGLDLRLVARVPVEATLRHVRLAHDADADADLPAAFDWLPFLALGPAATRRKGAVRVDPGPGGLVAHGPDWKLRPGRYRLGLNGTPDRTGGDGVVLGATVLVNATPAATAALSADALAGGEGVLAFVVDELDAALGTVTVQVSGTGAGFTLTSVVLEAEDGPAPGSGAGAGGVGQPAPGRA